MNPFQDSTRSTSYCPLGFFDDNYRHVVWMCALIESMNPSLGFLIWSASYSALGLVDDRHCHSALTDAGLLKGSVESSKDFSDGTQHYVELRGVGDRIGSIVSSRDSWTGHIRVPDYWVCRLSYPGRKTALAFVLRLAYHHESQSLHPSRMNVCLCAQHWALYHGRSVAAYGSCSAKYRAV